MHYFFNTFPIFLIIQSSHSHVPRTRTGSSNNTPLATPSPHHCAQHRETKSPSTNREKLTVTTRVLPTSRACASITPRSLLWRHCCDVGSSLQVGQDVPPPSLSLSSITSNCTQGNQRKLSPFTLTFCFNKEFCRQSCHLCGVRGNKCYWLR